MIKELYPLILMLCIYSANLSAQDRTHTMAYDSITGSPNATIEEVAWIQGHWISKDENMLLEEVWFPPQAGVMLCSFQWIEDDRVNFFEMLTISEVNNSLLLRLRHFSPDLSAWEEKDAPMEFPLVHVDGQKAFFNNFTFERTSRDHLNVYVLFHKKDGSYNEKKFSYQLKSN